MLSLSFSISFFERYVSTIYSFLDAALHKFLFFLPMRAVTWNAMVYRYLAKIYSKQNITTKVRGSIVNGVNFNSTKSFKISYPWRTYDQSHFSFIQNSAFGRFLPVTVLDLSSSSSNKAVIMFQLTIFGAPAQAIFICSSEENEMRLPFLKKL